MCDGGVCYPRGRAHARHVVPEHVLFLAIRYHAKLTCHVSKKTLTGLYGPMVHHLTSYVTYKYILRVHGPKWYNKIMDPGAFNSKLL